MSKPEIIEKTSMNVVEVKAALEKIRAKEPELNFRAQKTEEYAQDFAKIRLAEVAEIKEKLAALDVSRLRDTHINKLIDIMPASEKQVKLILTTMNTTLPADAYKKIADIMIEHAPKKN
jgi:DNA-directed RNA polymerase subunit F